MEAIKRHAQHQLGGGLMAAGRRIVRGLTSAAIYYSGIIQVADDVTWQTLIEPQLAIPAAAAFLVGMYRSEPAPSKGGQ